jgi:nicotinamide-nucleotide amidase
VNNDLPKSTGHMNAEILAVGTELLLGEIVDTNSAFLAEEMAQIGVNVYWISQLGDNPGRLREAFERALGRSHLVLVTGGLGPTDDDQTREAIASALGETPAVDPELERALRARFGAMGRRMPEKNVKQAWLIPSAEAIPNPAGTAPGWWVAVGDRHIAAMPGVPREMRQMWREQVRPRLEAVSDRSLAVRTVKTFGPGESAVEERLGDLVKAANPSVATYAKQDGVHVRVAASAATRDQAIALLDPVVHEVYDRLGRDVYGENDATLATVVGDLLRKRGATVATAESLTGGLVCSYLTDVPGSSDYVRGGVVAYTADAKERLGVPHDVLDEGVVSAATAEALAQAACRNLRADYGIATTGVAGPASHDGQPPGTVFVAVAGPDGARSSRVGRLGSRDVVKHFAALSAIDLLRRTLSG